jgi:hypothetical protein
MSRVCWDFGDQQIVVRVNCGPQSEQCLKGQSDWNQIKAKWQINGQSYGFGRGQMTGGVLQG